MVGKLICYDSQMIGITVIANNEEELQRMLRCIKETLLNELNMKINTKKTKVLVYSRKNNISVRIGISAK